jgi:aminoglycoside/choline kinase family phosphotransferase
MRTAATAQGHAQRVESGFFPVPGGIVIAEQDSSRRRHVVDWVARQFGWRVSRLEPASADASFRRYYRLKPGQHGLPRQLSLKDGRVLAREGDTHGVIVMDAPPPAEDLGRFVHAARRLAAAGLHVPAVHASDLEAGLALVGDLGTITYLDMLAAGGPQQVPYEAAIDALVRLQLAPTSGWPDYDEALLRRELGLFRDWYLDRHLQQRPSGEVAKALDTVFDRLVARSLGQPRVLVHRDYHSRNLMASPPLPGILDFQDAVVGPLAYDVVSLLRDCYVELPAPMMSRLLRHHRRQALAAGITMPDEACFAADLDWTGVQRHLKVLGIFVRLYYRDQRLEYLQYLPRVRRYLTAACARHASLRQLGALLESLAPQDEARVREIRAGLIRSDGA